MKRLDQLFNQARTQWDALCRSDDPVIWIASGSCSQAAGADAVARAMRDELAARGRQARFVRTGCMGLCYLEPTVIVRSPGCARVVYGPLDETSARRLVGECVLADGFCPDLAIGRLDAGPPEDVPDLSDHPAMRNQVRRVMQHCGLIDPEDLSHYLANGGYEAFRQALAMPADQVVERLKASGLRGRSGGGFPVWRKWEFTRSAKGEQRYVLCNAHEGDPGAFANRLLAESDPHGFLEGMLIAAFTVGATQGYIYMASEYPVAHQRVAVAIDQLRCAGLLGDDILGSGFSFDITLRSGAGVFVTGEETAQIASIEGRRGAPASRPPYPGQAGIAGVPTLVQNVETLANVPLIIAHGDEWFRAVGTTGSPGTKAFSLSGRLARRGVFELPLGIGLGHVVNDAGGGARDEHPLKVVHTGGPPGGLLPADIEVPLDFDSMAETGSFMGSGGLIAMDDRTCVVDLARHFMEFAQDEACGQCVPCRNGNRLMLDILNRLTQGQGTPADLDRLLELGNVVRLTSLCGLGQTAPNPVLTGIRYFRNEFEAHLHGSCPAGVCSLSSPAERIAGAAAS
jgi:NADH-quinone oxidoreductase subunit F